MTENAPKRRGGIPAVTLLALEPRYMYDAAGVAALDEVRNLAYANSVSEIAELQASLAANPAERDAAGTFGNPDSLAFPVFREVSGAGLRHEFTPDAAPQTLKEIPTGPSGGSVYALSGAFTRPLLQGNPIGYLWTYPTPSGGLTEITPENYYRELNTAFLEGMTPETPVEIQTQAQWWADDAQEAMNELTEQRAEAAEGIDTENAFLNEVYPAVESAVEAMEQSFDADSWKAPDASEDTLEDGLEDAAAAERFVRTLDRNVRLDMEADALDTYIRGKEIAAEELVLEKGEDTLPAQALDTAEDLYRFETQDIQTYSDFDNLTWSLWINDMQDMASGLDTGAEGVREWQELNPETADEAAFLDNKSFSAQIQEDVREFDNGVADLLKIVGGQKKAMAD